MNPQTAATEFELVIAMSDLVIWPENSDAPQKQHPMLQAVFDALGAQIDLTPMTTEYFEDTDRAGRGDVHVFDFNGNSTPVVAVDTYNEPTDQLDLIRLYIRCNRSECSHVSGLVWKFFNACSVQIYGSQHAYCAGLRAAIDSSQFPRRIGSGGYLQSQVRHTAA